MYVFRLIMIWVWVGAGWMDGQMVGSIDRWIDAERQRERERERERVRVRERDSER